MVALHGDEPLREELADDAAPLDVAQFGADAEGLQRVVVELDDLGVLLAEEDVDDVAAPNFWRRSRSRRTITDSTFWAEMVASHVSGGFRHVSQLPQGSPDWPK